MQIIERLNKYIVSNDWNDINKIFDSKLLGNMPDGEPVVPWKGIERRVKLSNFLRFSFVTFNIYYLSIILSFASASGVIVYHSIKKNKSIQNELPVEPNKIPQNNLLKIDSVDQKCDTIVNTSTTDTCADISGRKQEKNKDTKKLLLQKKEEPHIDTVINVVTNKKIVNQQVVVKRRKHFKDTVIFN